MIRQLSILALTIGVGAAAPAIAQGERPKNIIVFIADGCGQNTHRAYELWRGEPPIYRGDAWNSYSVATYALRKGARPSNDLAPLEQDPRLVYDPAKAWDTTPAEGKLVEYPFYFEGYRWLRSTAPDSANTASAIFTGVPTYVGAINMDGAGNPTRSVAEVASNRGMTVGVVTSVTFPHATPASASGAHVPLRSMYHDITHQMLTAGVCDVIAGAGHPWYDDNAARRDEPSFTFIAEDDWASLRAGTLGPAEGEIWTLVEEPSEVRALATGDTPERLFMLARAGQTLQQQRTPRQEAKKAPPESHPLNAGVPTLNELTLAALNAIDDDPDGFFLMVEGGAVDWAMHDNQLGRVIDEMTDYDRTITAVCEILDAGDRGYDWSNTLVIVTADHDHLLWGPESDTIPFQPLAGNGPGNTPGYTWHSNGHSNQPVPMFVRGAGGSAFEAIVTQPDSATTPDGTRLERPRYFHQREIGRTLLRVLDSPEVGASSTPSSPPVRH
jgi:alkaline phosphatase